MTVSVGGYLPPPTPPLRNPKESNDGPGQQNNKTSKQVCTFVKDEGSMGT